MYKKWLKSANDKINITFKYTVFKVVAIKLITNFLVETVEFIKQKDIFKNLKRKMITNTEYYTQ